MIQRVASQPGLKNGTANPGTNVEVKEMTEGPMKKTTASVEPEEPAVGEAVDRQPLTDRPTEKDVHAAVHQGPLENQDGTDLAAKIESLETKRAGQRHQFVTDRVVKVRNVSLPSLDDLKKQTEIEIRVS